MCNNNNSFLIYIQKSAIINVQFKHYKIIYLQNIYINSATWKTTVIIVAHLEGTNVLLVTIIIEL